MGKVNVKLDLSYWATLFIAIFWNTTQFIILNGVIDWYKCWFVRPPTSWMCNQSTFFCTIIDDNYTQFDKLCNLNIFLIPLFSQTWGIRTPWDQFFIVWILIPLYCYECSLIHKVFTSWVAHHIISNNVCYGSMSINDKHENTYAWYVL